MYDKLSSDRFSWSLMRDDRGLTTVLTDHKLTKTKTFFQAGAAPTEWMNEHMNTLTDDLCEAFWPKPRVDKKKAKQLKQEETQ